MDFFEKQVMSMMLQTILKLQGVSAEDFNKLREIAELPADIDARQPAIMANWTVAGLAGQSHCLQSLDDESTITEESLVKVGRIINEAFAGEIPLRILEAGAGNCKASKIIYGEMKDVDVQDWHCTDVAQHSPPLSAPMHYSPIHAVDAVARFGTQANILLLISPMPTARNSTCGWFDYFAIRDFAKLDGNRFVIFVGELGAADGSHGIFKYLMEHPVLKLKNRVEFSRIPDVIGGECVREVFVFEKRE